MRLHLLEAGEEGFEPPLTVLETAALPLYYSPICLVVLPTNCIIARNNSKGKRKMQFYGKKFKVMLYYFQCKNNGSLYDGLFIKIVYVK